MKIATIMLELGELVGQDCPITVNEVVRLWLGSMAQECGP